MRIRLNKAKITVTTANTEEDDRVCNRQHKNTAFGLERQKSQSER
jgi:hypothetical protein